MKNVDTLIIGAGISGLTYAANCTKDYLIIEKEATVGGLCRTFYQDGFIWDFAGHFFHFATPEVKSMFESVVAENDMVRCIKETDINYYNCMVTYPFQMNIHQLPMQEFIDCLYDLFNKAEKDEYDSFEDMLYGKFGKSITEKFLKPYNEKLYACDLNELDTDAMGRFFPYANPKQIIDNMKQSGVKTYNSTFDYPKQGAQFFVNIVNSMIEQDRIWLNKTVQAVNVEKQIVTVGGENIHYNTLINTMPLNHFVKILPKDCTDEIGKTLTCNKVLVFNLGFDKQALNTKTHWTYFPDKSINFYRAGYYCNILGSDRLSMYIEIGFKEQDDINIEEQLKLTLDNLRKCKIITDHQLISYNSLIINPGYVHITKKSSRKVEIFRDKMSTKGIYTIGRYGKWTYCSIEDCMVDAINLCKKLCGATQQLS